MGEKSGNQRCLNEHSTTDLLEVVMRKDDDGSLDFAESDSKSKAYLHKVTAVDADGQKWRSHEALSVMLR